jgi:hypothetical protein
MFGRIQLLVCRPEDGFYFQANHIAGFGGVNLIS